MQSILIKVVFPAPLGPSMPNISPSWTSKSSPDKASMKGPFVPFMDSSKLEKVPTFLLRPCPCPPPLCCFLAVVGYSFFSDLVCIA